MRLPWTLHGSDVRRISDMAGESLLLAGGGRAILLQLANPGVGHGVAEHSDFVERPLSRLHGTMTYLYAIVFGTPSEVAHVRRVVGRAHRPVHDGGSSSVRYDAFDPGLQLWVAATVYQSAITMFELCFGPLPDEAADRIHRQYAVLGTELQVPEGMWPADRAAFRAYWDERIAMLEPTSDARRVARTLLDGRGAPPAVRAVMPLVALVTAGLLPPRIRAGFGMRWDARLVRRCRRLLAPVLAVYRVLPRIAREAPRSVITRRYRRRAAG